MVIRFIALYPSPSGLEAVYRYPTIGDRLLPVACLAVRDDGEVVTLVADRWGCIEDPRDDQFWIGWVRDGEWVEEIDRVIASVDEATARTCLPVAAGTMAIFEDGGGYRLTDVRLVDLDGQYGARYVIVDSKGELIDAERTDGFVGYLYPGEDLRSSHVEEFLIGYQDVMADDAWVRHCRDSWRQQW